MASNRDFIGAMSTREAHLHASSGNGALRVAVDFRPVEQARAGIARYVSELVQRMALHTGLDLFLISSDPLQPVRQVLRGERLDEATRGVKIPFPFKKIVRVCFTEPRYSTALRRMQVVWGTNYSLPAHGRVSGKRVLTVHDMSWLYHPETLQDPTLRMLANLSQHLHAADRVLTVSEATKDDLVRRLEIDPRKITVIYNGVSDRFRSLDTPLDNVQERYRLPKRFFLFVGTVEPRKNLARLIEAFERAGRHLEHSLVVVGAKGWKTSPIYRAIETSRVRDRIQLLGFVADADLPAIYNLADAFVYPSLYEGFGIPIVEAMACGTPVVTSNVSAMPEVAGDAALLIEPLDPHGLAEAMERIVQDGALRNSLRAKGLERAKRFSWDTSAAQVVQSFRELCS